eukprot:1160563-Pelagomonas_calceolata.AAC.20
MMISVEICGRWPMCVNLALTDDQRYKGSAHIKSSETGLPPVAALQSRLLLGRDVWNALC